MSDYLTSPKLSGVVRFDPIHFEGILITYIGDPPIPCVSVLSANPDKASILCDRAREILFLLRK